MNTKRMILVLLFGVAGMEKAHAWPDFLDHVREKFRATGAELEEAARQERYNKKDAQGKTLLHYAAQRGDVTEIRKLLALAADPNIVDNAKKTPIFYAAAEGHDKAVAVLLAANAKVNGLDTEGVNALFYAVGANDAHCVVALLKAKSDPNVVEVGSKTTPLHRAVIKNNEAIVKMLITAGANVFARNAASKMPVEYARDTVKRDLEQRMNEIFNSLLRQINDADVAQDDAMVSIGYMLQEGMDINMSTPAGMTLLCQAAASGKIRIVEMLIQVPNIEITARALWYAVEVDSLAIVMLLMKKNPDIVVDEKIVAQAKQCKDQRIHVLLQLKLAQQEPTLGNRARARFVEMRHAASEKWSEFRSNGGKK